MEGSTGHLLRRRELGRCNYPPCGLGQLAVILPLLLFSYHQAVSGLVGRRIPGYPLLVAASHSRRDRCKDKVVVSNQHFSGITSSGHQARHQGRQTSECRWDDLEMRQKIGRQRFSLLSQTMFTSNLSGILRSSSHSFRILGSSSTRGMAHRVLRVSWFVRCAIRLTYSNSG